MGPGETRDPFLIQIDGIWHMYYAGYYDHAKPEEGAGFVVRTSKDLLNWSDWKLVHRDPSFGDDRIQTECPHVIYREGYYYLFVSPLDRNRAARAVRRLLRSVATRHHLRKPWYIPVTLVSELLGLFWALGLRLKGPALPFREKVFANKTV